MDFIKTIADVLGLPIPVQVAMLTFGLTGYIKEVLPGRIRVYTPFIAMLLGVGLMMLFTGSLLLTNVSAGLVIGFLVTSFYKEFKGWLKSIGTK